LTANINVYDVYGICWQNGGAPEEVYDAEGENKQTQLFESREMGVSNVRGNLKFYKKGFTAMEYTPWLFRHQTADDKHLQSLPPCTFGVPLLEYFNSETVRTALHIDDSTQAWDMCSDSIFYTSDYVNGSL